MYYYINFTQYRQEEHKLIRNHIQFLSQEVNDEKRQDMLQQIETQMTGQRARQIPKQRTGQEAERGKMKENKRHNDQ